MWSVILALLQSVPILARIIEKLTPTRREREITKVEHIKKHEREKIDAWIDRGGTPPL